MVAALPPAPAEPAADGPWALPAEGACEPSGGLRAAPDDRAPAVAPGQEVSFAALEQLRALLPAAIWSHRERFFSEGMRLEIGPCFRDYAPPDFFQQATRLHAGRARIVEGGGLAEFAAGLPFPPETIAPEAPDAGLRWAWNVAWRYQAAGFRGRFRIVEIEGPLLTQRRYQGEIFQVRLAHRADRPAPDHRAPGARRRSWVAGGLYTEPGDAREFAWRQIRDERQLTDPGRSDDLHAYLPAVRRALRLSGALVEGLYLPSFSLGAKRVGASGGGGGPTGAAMGAAGALAGAGAASVPSRRTGFEGLALRPALYAHELVGVRDVLAPINAGSAAYPVDRGRSFGAWGLAFADDRWDLRRALVLRSRRQAPPDGTPAEIVRYVDLQTLQPLYYVATDVDGELGTVGLYVGRWSEDRPGYPGWPDDPERPVRVIDPVAAAFTDARLGDGWRREAWELVGTPLPDAKQQKLLSVNELTKRK